MGLLLQEGVEGVGGYRQAQPGDDGDVSHVTVTETHELQSNQLSSL